MKPWIICLAVCLPLLLVAGTPQRPLEEKGRAPAVKAEEISYLPPSAFPHLLHTIQRNLQQRGYRIPQAYDQPGPHNVISGDFQARGQTDYAVLCSKGGQSWIMVFWGGSINNPAKIAVGTDEDFLQSLPDGRRVYTRRIEPVTEEYIRRNCSTPDGSRPPILHGGIHDIHAGQGAVVHYRSLDDWVGLVDRPPEGR
jgi:hypothetical protein